MLKRDIFKVLLFLLKIAPSDDIVSKLKKDVCKRERSGAYVLQNKNCSTDCHKTLS